MEIRVVAALLLLLSLAFLHTPKEKWRVVDWHPNKTYVTAGKVERVGSLDMGIVSIKKIPPGFGSDPVAEVIPFREIPLGSEVRISQVTLGINSLQVTTIPSEFLVVTEVVIK